MSPQVENFVHSLVEMAKATEELPQVRRELAEAQASNEKLSQAIGDREESILKLKAEIDRLQAKVREAEVSRDDAELRFLEVEDRMAQVSKGIAMAREALGEADRTLNPPKPVPTSEPMVVSSEGTPSASGVGFSVPSNPQPGQSEPDPTVTSEITSQPSAPIGSVETPISASTNAPSYADEPANKYSQEWYDWAIRMDDWYGVNWWPARPVAAS